jgi:hypothetical protein
MKPGIDKIADVANMADYFVKQNIWPSSNRIDKLFGKLDSFGAYTRRELRMWKNEIGLRCIDRRGFRFKVDKKQCGKDCGDYRITYCDKILCPIHYTVKDVS